MCEIVVIGDKKGNKKDVLSVFSEDHQQNGIQAKRNHEPMNLQILKIINISLFYYNSLTNVSVFRTWTPISFYHPQLFQDSCLRFPPS